MFLTLLLVTFAVSTLVSVLVVVGFRKPVGKILQRIIADDLCAAWVRYLMFALYVVGISSGVRIWDLEKYITRPPVPGGELVQLNTDRWILEVYRTIVSTLQGLAWVLFAFFVCTLLAFVRVFEARKQQKNGAPEPPGRFVLSHSSWSKRWRGGRLAKDSRSCG
jgi:hypothetical protein